MDKNGQEIKEGDVLSLPVEMNESIPSDFRIYENHITKVEIDVKSGSSTTELGSLKELQAQYGNSWEIMN